MQLQLMKLIILKLFIFFIHPFFFLSTAGNKINANIKAIDDGHLISEHKIQGRSENVAHWWRALPTLWKALSLILTAMVGGGERIQNIKWIKSHFFTTLS